MDLKILQKQLDELNHRLRIIILQNARQENGYDDDFLSELNQVTRQILGLKRILKKQADNIELLQSGEFQYSSVRF